MTSSRLILIFLAFIFLIIVILSSNRISAALRARFAGILPSMNATTEDITPTPTTAETPTPTPTIVYGGGSTKNGASNAKNIPATGPQDFALLVLGGSLFIGVTLTRISAKRS